MTLFVPYDGSDLSRAALGRATTVRGALDDSVAVVTVVPRGDADYAAEHGWIDDGDDFEMDAVVASVREDVTGRAPDADFEAVTVDRFAPAAVIARRLRDAAHERDASVVFLGSENAADLVSTLGSVGSAVAADDAYDVYIVRDVADAP